ncbi:MAG TPA: hypothetical protein VEZ50_14830 [Nodosilinea sp.]|nr:hypothetical protein [Nodosilinea sp.]
MNAAETIYELVKTLPEDQASLVLIFAQFVQQHSGPIQASLHESDRQPWPVLVAQLSGAWPDSPTAEELRASLGQDVAREVL